jgi:tetratricopeptide (TPR) repeat protein
VLILAVLPWSGIRGGGTFQVSTDIRKAYDLVLALQLQDASDALNTIAADDPENLMVHYIGDYIDFLSVLITDDPAIYQATRSTRESRMRIISLGEVSSPYYLFVQAEMYLHRGLLRFKFGEDFYGATDLNQAFKLLKRNQKRFPEFSPNLKTLGVLKAAFGTVPESYRWAVELLSSMEGSVEEGLRDLESALEDKSQLMYPETQYMYLLALLHFKNAPEEALTYARENGIRADGNPLQCFILSHIALKAGQNDFAIEWLSSGMSNHSANLIPQLQLMYGTAKLQRLDADADEPLRAFLVDHPGLSYRREAMQKLAWCALINNDNAGYEIYMDRCKMEGSAVTESDKYALVEAQKSRVPHIELLKVRLLSDGGYYLKALEVLESFDYGLLDDDDQLEFRYRAGRIYHHIGREYDALFSYKLAMSMGRNDKGYYACAAALYTGQLYEAKSEMVNAEQYYRICLGMSPEEYQSGLHQKAKAGLGRVRQ